VLETMNISKILRYGLAAVGPIATAAAQFLLSLHLLHVLSVDAFGSFSFLMVASQFSTGLWGALFCAPLPILIAANQPDPRNILKVFFSTNIALSLAIVAIFSIMGAALSLKPADTLIFAVYAAANLLRAFGRAHAYSHAKPMRTTASDLTYSGCLLLGIASTHFSAFTGVTGPFLLLAAGALLGLLPFGPKYLFDQFINLSFARLRDYRHVWAKYSQWSLLGVVTTEATANAHAYLVTLIIGPAAFAPVAAAALFIRPIAVVTNALTDFERPQLARMLGEQRFAQARATLGFFRIVLTLTWLAACVAAVSLMLYAPRLIFPTKYAYFDLAAGGTLWMVVALIRTIRVPESVLLQAGGIFKDLAKASVVSSGFSIVAVALLIWLCGPIWSIVGVLIGEAVFAAQTWRQSRRWLASASSAMKPDSAAVNMAEHRASSRDDQMKVTVGIKALNEERHIEAAILSALEAVKPFGGEVVLADSCSSDRTIEIARRYPVRIVQLANAGDRCCGAGAQLAFQAAKGEFFYLMDGDMVLSPDFLAPAIEFLTSHPEFAAVGGRVVEKHTASQEFMIRANTVASNKSWLAGEVDRLDCGGLYRTSSVEAVGYFADRNLHAFEEFELAARLQSRGMKLARIDVHAVDHFGHQMNGYKLLRRRMRTGYSGAPGEVLKGAIGKMHLPIVLRRLGHIRNGAAVACWWGLELLTLALGTFVSPLWLFASLLLVALPLAFLIYRRRSVQLGIYSLVAWNVSALGLIMGFLRPRQPPATPLRFVDITQGAQS
jgi:glycosyltransferase involved in cell wall biosynthesis